MSGASAMMTIEVNAEHLRLPPSPCRSLNPGDSQSASRSSYRAFSRLLSLQHLRHQLDSGPHRHLPSLTQYHSAQARFFAPSFLSCVTTTSPVLLLSIHPSPIHHPGSQSQHRLFSSTAILHTHPYPPTIVLFLRSCSNFWPGLL